MTKLEQLKEKMQEEYTKYKNLHIQLENKKDMINGCLNRIAVSDDENEVERMYQALLKYNIAEYKDIARKAHQQWLVYDKIFNEYVKEKNND